MKNPQCNNLILQIYQIAAMGEIWFPKLHQISAVYDVIFPKYIPDVINSEPVFFNFWWTQPACQILCFRDFLVKS